MKKFLKQRKGFSLVELLIALLIMAVIAGTAITLFGGVLDTGKRGADKETAEGIKRAILTYINASNDTDLDCLGCQDTPTPDQLIRALECTVSIAANHQYTIAKLTSDEGSAPTTTSGTGDNTDFEGVYGPFLDYTKNSLKPQAKDAKGWNIVVDGPNQIITVKVATVDTEVKLDIK